VSEARLEDGVPQTAGWFVVNSRDVPWMRNEMRTLARFGGQGEAHFDDLGIALYALREGQAMSMYHHEAGQEDFLVLRGRCVLIVEGVERELRAWDLFHCPPRTPHTIVATGDEPALVVAVGARKERGSARYPFDATAARHGASAERDTDSAAEAYARFSAPVRGPAPPLF
jgi:quercetin dioxygenase-like cupin family protein